MTYKQDARNFILKHGIDMAIRIADTPYSFYSIESGSYYATDKNNSISIKHLKRAIIEYDKIVKAKIEYDKRYLEFMGRI